MSMTDKEKILAFIEERIEWNKEMMSRDPKPSDIGRIEEAKCIMRFIDSMQENPCNGCTNRKGCVTCENGELRETMQEAPKHKFVVGNKIIYLNEEYEIVNITDHYILHTTKRTKIKVLHLAFDNEEFMELVEEPVSDELETSIIEYMNHVPENEPESSNTLYTYEQMQDIARHFAQWGKNRQEPVSDDLEKVVEEIVDPIVLNAYGVKEIANRLRRTMIDSASEDLEEVVEKLWQEINTGHQYSILDSYNQFYGICLDVCEWQKQQMMKDAIDAEITYGKSLAIPSLGYKLDKEGLDFSDKVKVIIIKK